MRRKDFEKALQVTIPETLVRGTIVAVLPNNRGQVAVSTGPMLRDVLLPSGAQTNDNVLLFRAPRDNVWRAVLTDRQDQTAIPDSDANTTFVTVPEHVRWFTVYDKVALSWYVWPKFIGVFEVQIAFENDQSDALTWTVTSGGVSIFNPGDNPSFYARIRAINQFFVTSAWTEWYHVFVDNTVSGGNAGEIAIWDTNGLRSDSRLLWQDNRRLYVGDTPTASHTGNLYHQGVTLDTHPYIEQTFIPGCSGNITNIRLGMSSLQAYTVRVCLLVSGASLFTSDVSQVPGTVTIPVVSDVPVTAESECSLVIHEIESGDYPHMFYTRWNMYPDGQVVIPALTDDVDIAFDIEVDLDNTPEFVTIDDGIGFNDQWRLEQTVDDVELAHLGTPALAISTHNHAGTAGMGTPIAAEVVTFTPTASDWTAPAPTTVATALNALAAREEGSSSNAVTNLRFHLAGAVATASEIDGVYIFPAYGQVNSVYVYCKDTGSAGSTVVDVNKNGTSIFSTKPELLYNEVTKTVVGIPDTHQYSQYDILTIDIDSVATGATDITVVVVLETITSWLIPLDQIELDDLPTISLEESTIEV